MDQEHPPPPPTHCCRQEEEQQQQQQQEPSLSSSKWFDIIISAGGRPFPANKTILIQNSDYFKSILRMYSGSLALNSGNAYQVLFYAQLLQMTPAILQCKNFLVNHSFQNIFPWAAAAAAAASTLYPKQWIFPLNMFPPTTATSQLSAPTPAPPTIPLPQSLPHQKIPISPFHCTTTTLMPPLPPPHLLFLINSYNESQSEHSIKSEPKTQETHQNKEPEPSCSTSPSNQCLREENHPTLLDLAACDGPVSFQRVPNPHSFKKQSKNETSTTSPPNEGDSSSDDEAHAQKEGKQKSDQVYQCLFCNHTFKSQYCYQKHKQRHLNPFSLDFQTGDSIKKKSLILKDINVQFFPCKICGAKFPSYYFVHKHKKLWHTQEEEEEAENRFRRAKLIKEYDTQSSK
ncbi:unnamed protein product [Lepeophtheirus salmonis]|uniref:(salmon louse) hypothetical protein n=1 Tax=Lepeophtheirus salmonis TaxID=72036 RepID=A0A7R8H2H0_LEPSM|nr:unnamed protein product [Lepeophtheirus salmonis]CAF2824248.1 unnamed protein product [Lepeophtheirus salmonis]